MEKHSANIFWIYLNKEYTMEFVEFLIPKEIYQGTSQNKDVVLPV